MTAWFARVGLPLSAEERRLADDWARGAPPQSGSTWRSVATWAEAAGVVHAMDIDSTWWDQEEGARENLWLVAANALGEAELLRRLTSVAEDISGDVRARAEAATKSAGVTDPAICREAAGAAMLAAHQYALLAAAGANVEHGFAHKYALFRAGRWPLGYHFGEYVIF
jgi:hypothetical protein